MGQYTEIDSILSQNITAETAPAKRMPLIDRLVDPSNVVFSLVFCQKARAEFELRRSGAMTVQTG